MLDYAELDETIAVLQRGGRTYEGALRDVGHLAGLSLAQNLRYQQLHQPTIERLFAIIEYTAQLLDNIDTTKEN